MQVINSPAGRVVAVVATFLCLNTVPCLAQASVSSDASSFIRTALAKADKAIASGDIDIALADYSSDYTQMDSAGKETVSSKAAKHDSLEQMLSGANEIYARSAVKDISDTAGGEIATVQTALAYTIMEGKLPVTDVYEIAVQREFWEKSGTGWLLKRSRDISRQMERTDVRDMPPLGSPVEVEPGVELYKVQLPRAGANIVWIYMPENLPSSKIACVFVAPAGTPLIYGNELGDGDQPEQLPYVRAGYAVVGYEIDGPEPDNPTVAQLPAGMLPFMKADAGVLNARQAIDYALARIPNIDPNRLFCAGHSSAATLSLQVAEHDPRIAGCIAYAPVCDVPEDLGDRRMAAYDRLVPGFSGFLRSYSPSANAFALTCPLFLFHADDDSRVPISQVSDFAEQVKATNPNVTFIRVPTGDHYDSMIEQGIPDAIRWLQSLPLGQ